MLEYDGVVRGERSLQGAAEPLAQPQPVQLEQQRHDRVCRSACRHGTLDRRWLPKLRQDLATSIHLSATSRAYLELQMH